jgi:L-malate glycosyltransferase
MSLFSFHGKKKQRPLVMHFASWYPTKDNHVEGIFIQRQIELLASDKQFNHVVVRKRTTPVSAYQHLNSVVGVFKEERIGSMNVVSLPVESGLYTTYFWRHREAIERAVLQRLVKRYEPDLVHLHVVYGFAKEALYLNEVKGIPFIVSEHMGPFPFDWLQHKEGIVRKPIREASAVVAVSSAQARQIEEYTGVKAIVIPNVVDEDSFRYEEREHRDTKKNGLQLVFVGIYAKAKGVDYVLRVFPDFLNVHPGSTLHLVGAAKADRMLELNALIAGKGIENNVQFHGQLSSADLNTLHNSCDFYVCGSEWESFGLSMLEALFTGLPVLSTNCGGVVDFVTDENGLLLENNQQEQTLLNGLLQMASQLYSFNRKLIAANVRQRFSNQVIKDRYLTIYNKVLPSSNYLKAL